MIRFLFLQQLLFLSGSVLFGAFPGDSVSILSSEIFGLSNIHDHITVCVVLTCVGGALPEVCLNSYRGRRFSASYFSCRIKLYFVLFISAVLCLDCLL